MRSNRSKQDTIKAKRDAASCGLEGSLRWDVYDVRRVGLGSSRVIPNAVAARLLASAEMCFDGVYLLLVALAPQLRTVEVLR
jgi:hypothetical protein